MMITIGSDEMIVSFPSCVTQPTNSYVCNPYISVGEIPNVREDFMAPRKRIRGANANNIGKLS
jgi:hypothetical protein